MMIVLKRKGQSLAEWALAVALISVVIMATLFTFAPKMINMLDFITKSINQAQQQ